MKIENADIIIIGGGLTGLTLAYLLKQKQVAVKIIEARPRIGGRILTLYEPKAAPTRNGRYLVRTQTPEPDSVVVET